MFPEMMEPTLLIIAVQAWGEPAKPAAAMAEEPVPLRILPVLTVMVREMLPAILEGNDTTVVVPDTHRITVDEYRNLILEHHGGGAHP